MSRNVPKDTPPTTLFSDLYDWHTAGEQHPRGEEWGQVQARINEQAFALGTRIPVEPMFCQVCESPHVSVSGSWLYAESRFIPDSPGEGYCEECDATVDLIYGPVPREPVGGTCTDHGTDPSLIDDPEGLCAECLEHYDACESDARDGEALDAAERARQARQDADDLDGGDLADSDT